MGNTKVYDNKIIVILMLIVFYPVGLMLLCISKCFKRKILCGTLFFYIYTVVFIPTLSLFSFLLFGIGDKISTVIAADSIIFSILMLPLVIIIDIILFIRKKSQNNSLPNSNCQQNNLPLQNNGRYYGVITQNNFTTAAPTYNSMPQQNYYGYYVNSRWQSTNVPVQNYTGYYGSTSQENSGYQPALSNSVTQKSVTQTSSLGNYTAQAYNKKEKSNYKKASLLTANEQNFYSHLRVFAETYNFNVLSKIRLADIVNVNQEIQNSEWWSHFGKIKSKHIDFALANKETLEIQLLIELDDSTHDRADRKQRDEFVDSVCREVGIPIIHLRNTANLEKILIQKLFN